MLETISMRGGGGDFQYIIIRFEREKKFRYNLTYHLKLKQLYGVKDQKEWDNDQKLSPPVIVVSNLSFFPNRIDSKTLEAVDSYKKKHSNVVRLLKDNYSLAEVNESTRAGYRTIQRVSKLIKS